YPPTTHNTLAKFVDSITHVGDWQSGPVLVTLATIAVWLAAHAVRRLETVATLIALLVVTLLVALLAVPVELVRDIAEIPRALPAPLLPDPAAMLVLAPGALAVALVALAQAAGISAAVPNPDGTRPDSSRDFLAQGVANVAGGFLQAMPVGGSLSRTGVAVSAGATTRWAGIVAGISLILVVLVAGPAAGLIPMAVIAGLVIVIGVELVVGRLSDIRLVVSTSAWSTVAMIATFLGTTQLPLQQAVVLGVFLSLVLYALQASR